MGKLLADHMKRSVSDNCRKIEKVKGCEASVYIVVANTFTILWIERCFSEQEIRENPKF